MKLTAEFTVKDLKELKIKMLNWANQFSIFCLLDNQQYPPIAIGIDKPAFECLLGVGKKRDVIGIAGNAFDSLKSFCGKPDSFLFGHFAYDLKNETEKLHSGNFDGIGFPDLYFFEPQIVLQLAGDKLTIYSNTSPEIIFSDINKATGVINDFLQHQGEIQSRIKKEDYIDAVDRLRAHILRGDCYEINFCQEFFGEDILIDPVSVYLRLVQVSPNPFSALYKLKDKYCICASPERYLKKNGTTLFSQPIKGTSPRDRHSKINDETNRRKLYESEKERSENTMVVDLVRNDLGKVCTKGSVKVTELHGVYSFPQVHQMISTIEGTADESLHWVDIIKATFPMGSMTGAPKKRVMELIEKFEQTRRGLFSGAIGYVMPGGDFDFNVVIRSILYNKRTGYLSYQAGSAITFKSNAEDEYGECLVKVKAIKSLIAGK